MKKLAQELFDRASNLAWLQYPTTTSNAQVSDWLVQARYYKASALILLDKPEDAIITLLGTSQATDWRWADEMASRVSLGK